MLSSNKNNNVRLKWNIDQIYLNGLITRTCCYTLPIIIIQDVVNNILMLRSYFLWFKHCLSQLYKLKKLASNVYRLIELP